MHDVNIRIIVQFLTGDPVYGVVRFLPDDILSYRVIGLMKNKHGP